MPELLNKGSFALQTSFVLTPTSAGEWDRSGAIWIASSDDKGNLYRKDFSVPAVNILRAHAYVAGNMVLLAVLPSNVFLPMMCV